jgi:predicted DNA-binding transcriptional regulator AlpA
MANPLAGLPPRLLRTQEAARFLGISIRTLEKHRTYGTGPTYRKIGGRVLYTVHDLESWSEIGTRKSTRRDDGRHGFPRASADARRAGQVLNAARRRS